VFPVRYKLDLYIYYLEEIQSLKGYNTTGGGEVLLRVEYS
jgi:hypothetical protein